ncbi:MAG: hypothetical protein J0H49_10710 [Acidobacteria bacterium]|nr:hypothetical protein [Acidobacteriota bacterium]
MPTLEAIVLEHIHELDSQSAAFREDMTLIARRWRQVIIDDLLGHDFQGKLASEQISLISRKLGDQLVRLGYPELAGEYLLTFVESEAYASALSRVTVPLGHAETIMGSTPLPANLAKQLRDFDYSAFTAEIGPAATRVIAKELALSAIVGKKRSDILETVESHIGSFAENASSYADTALRTFDRVVSMETWDEAGIDRFRYFGPADNRNRPFCSSHVGKTYDLSAIRTMSNGAGRWSDVLRYGGGLRCRHVWAPVVSERSDLRPAEQLSDWDTILQEERSRVGADRAAYRRAQAKYYRDNADLLTKGVDVQVGWSE